MVGQGVGVHLFSGNLWNLVRPSLKTRVRSVFDVREIRRPSVSSLLDRGVTGYTNTRDLRDSPFYSVRQSLPYSVLVNVHRLSLCLSQFIQLCSWGQFLSTRSFPDPVTDTSGYQPSKEQVSPYWQFLSGFLVRTYHRLLV